MKKIITSIAISLAGAAAAFAITDAQKEAFLGYLSNNVKGGETFAADILKAADANEVKTVAAWAEISPSDFNSFVQSQHPSVRGKMVWSVRRSLNRQFEPNSMQDMVINAGQATEWNARDNADAYAALKSSGFVVQGLLLEEVKRFDLAEKYGDVEVLRSLPEKYLAGRFGKYLHAIRKARLSPGDAYRLYSELSTNFAEYKTSVKEVRDNWEELQNDKNEAFMQFYAQQKLEALNK